MTAEQPTWPGPAPDDITAWLLVQAGHTVGRRFVGALAEAGLTPTQFGVLLQLDLHPGMSNGEIARSVLVTPQTMSELLASLAALGLIDRDPPTGRGHRIPTTLTSDGRAALHRCAASVAAVEVSLGLGPGDAAHVNQTLRQILRSAPPPRPG